MITIFTTNPHEFKVDVRVQRTTSEPKFVKSFFSRKSNKHKAPWTNGQVKLRLWLELLQVLALVWWKCCWDTAWKWLQAREIWRSWKKLDPSWNRNLLRHTSRWNAMCQRKRRYSTKCTFGHLFRCSHCAVYRILSWKTKNFLKEMSMRVDVGSFRPPQMCLRDMCKVKAFRSSDIPSFSSQFARGHQCMMIMAFWFWPNFHLCPMFFFVHFLTTSLRRRSKLRQENSLLPFDPACMVPDRFRFRHCLTQLGRNMEGCTFWSTMQDCHIQLLFSLVAPTTSVTCVKLTSLDWQVKCLFQFLLFLMYFSPKAISGENWDSRFCVLRTKGSENHNFVSHCVKHLALRHYACVYP